MFVVRLSLNFLVNKLKPHTNNASITLLTDMRKKIVLIYSQQQLQR